MSKRVTSQATAKTPKCGIWMKISRKKHGLQQELFTWRASIKTQHQWTVEGVSTSATSRATARRRKPAELPHKFASSILEPDCTSTAQEIFRFPPLGVPESRASRFGCVSPNQVELRDHSPKDSPGPLKRTHQQAQPENEPSFSERKPASAYLGPVDPLTQLAPFRRCPAGLRDFVEETGFAPPERVFKGRSWSFPPEGGCRADRELPPALRQKTCHRSFGESTRLTRRRRRRPKARRGPVISGTSFVVGTVLIQAAGTPKTLQQVERVRAALLAMEDC